MDKREILSRYQIKVDRNGYGPSIVGNGGGCYVCGKRVATQRHEFIHGFNREKSKMFGLWSDLCEDCHRRVHNADSELDWKLKEIAQRRAMERFGWSVEDFREIFGRNYLTEG